MRLSYEISSSRLTKYAYGDCCVMSPQCGKMKNLLSLSPKNISSNQLFSNLFSKSATFTEFLPKLREREFPKFRHCVPIPHFGNFFILNNKFKMILLPNGLLSAIKNTISLPSGFPSALRLWMVFLSARRALLYLVFISSSSLAFPCPLF